MILIFCHVDLSEKNTRSLLEAVSAFLSTKVKPEATDRYLHISPQNWNETGKPTLDPCVEALRVLDRALEETDLMGIVGSVYRRIEFACQLLSTVVHLVVGRLCS